MSGSNCHELKLSSRPDCASASLLYHVTDISRVGSVQLLEGHKSVSIATRSIYIKSFSCFRCLKASQSTAYHDARASQIISNLYCSEVYVYTAYVHYQIQAISNDHRLRSIESINPDPKILISSTIASKCGVSSPSSNFLHDRDIT